MTISLSKFVENNIGKKLANPNANLDNVFLLYNNIYTNCLDIPYKARAHAKEWVNLPSNIAKKATDGLKAGDIIVWPTRGVIEGITYGHIAIAISSPEIFEQNAWPNYVAQKYSFADAQKRSEYAQYVVMRRDILTSNSSNQSNRINYRICSLYR